MVTLHMQWNIFGTFFLAVSIYIYGLAIIRCYTAVCVGGQCAFGRHKNNLIPNPRSTHSIISEFASHTIFILFRGENILLASTKAPGGVDQPFWSCDVARHKIVIRRLVADSLAVIIMIYWELTSTNCEIKLSAGVHNQYGFFLFLLWAGGSRRITKTIIKRWFATMNRLMFWSFSLSLSLLV